MTEFNNGKAALPFGARDAAVAAQIECKRGISSLGTLAQVYGLWVAVAVIYWPTAFALNALWTHPAQHETFTHGYLILLISLWLIWRDRRELAMAPPQFQPLALMPLILLSALWVWFWRAAVQELHIIILPLILFTAILASLGPRVARRLVFPIGYLYFALPFWSVGVGILQALSARMTGVLTWLTGLPAFMQGNYIELPSGTIRIAGGCSGLHSFIVGLALATLYGKLFGLPMHRRLSAVALMSVITMAVNWVRIFIVTAVAYATDMHSSLVHHHYWLGWWLFAAAFAGFLWWMERKPPTDSNGLRATAPERSTPASASRSERPSITAIMLKVFLAMAILAALVAALYISLTRNYYRHFWIGWSLCIAVLVAVFCWMKSNHESGTSWPRAQDLSRPPVLARTGTRATPIVAALAGLAILPATAYGIDWAHANDNRAISVQWPAAPAGWEGPSRVFAGQWHPFFVHAGVQSLRAYTNTSGSAVQVFTVAYRVQTQSAKLLGYWNRLLGKSDDLRVQTQHVVESAVGPWIETRAIDRSGHRSLIWSRYRVGSRNFVEPRLSQIWYGFVAIINPPLSSLIALRSICGIDCRAARKRVAALAAKVQPTYPTANSRP